jgi:hypothetical protein
MTYEIFLDLFSLMPRCSIYINPNFETFEPMPYMFQNIQKGLTIPFDGSNEPTTSQKRSHPARKIQTFSMLACGRNSKWLTAFCPSPAQPRMEAKTCLILEDNRFFWLKASEFFLTTDESAWHPQNGLEYKHSWHASSDNPIDASNTVLVEPSDLHQSISSNEQPGLDHPIQHGTSQTPEDSSPDDLPISGQAPRSVAQDDQVEVSVEETQHLLCSPHESTDSSSCGSGPILELSIPDAGPPVPAIEPQSLYRSRLQGLFRQGLTTACELIGGDLRLIFSCREYSINFTIM